MFNPESSTYELWEFGQFSKLSVPQLILGLITLLKKTISYKKYLLVVLKQSGCVIFGFLTFT